MVVHTWIVGGSNMEEWWGIGGELFGLYRGIEGGVKEMMFKG